MRIAADTTETLQDYSCTPSYKISSSGYEKQGMHGAAICIYSRLTNNVMERKACGTRLCYMRLHAVRVAITLIFAYSQTEDSSESDKEQFYSELQKCLKNMPRKDVSIIGGDFNAKVCLPLDGEKQSIGRFLTGT